MNRTERKAVIVALIRTMERYGSWNGQTSIQKSIFLLQDMLNVPLQFKFIIHHYGPFSFELRDEITNMIGDGILNIEVPNEKYGPKMVIGSAISYLESRNGDLIKKYQDEIEYIGKNIGKMGINDLERIGTAQYVLTHPLGSKRSPAEQLMEIKPHISEDRAIDAVQVVQDMKSNFEKELS